MLTYNLSRIFKSRGINRPTTFFLKLCNQSKISGEQRIHVRIINRFAHHHAIQQNAFVMCADLLRYTSALLIPKSDHHLSADDAAMFKPIACSKFCRSPCDPRAMPRRPHPVAQVTKMIYRVKMI